MEILNCIREWRLGIGHWPQWFRCLPSSLLLFALPSYWNCVSEKYRMTRAGFIFVRVTKLFHINDHNPEAECEWCIPIEKGVMNPWKMEITFIEKVDGPNSAKWTAQLDITLKKFPLHHYNITITHPHNCCNASAINQLTFSSPSHYHNHLHDEVISYFSIVVPAAPLLSPPVLVLLRSLAETLPRHFLWSWLRIVLSMSSSLRVLPVFVLRIITFAPRQAPSPTMVRLQPWGSKPAWDVSSINS